MSSEGGTKIGEKSWVSTKLLITCIIAALAIGGLFVQVNMLVSDMREVKIDVSTIKTDIAGIKGALNHTTAYINE